MEGTKNKSPVFAYIVFFCGKQKRAFGNFGKGN